MPPKHLSRPIDPSPLHRAGITYPSDDPDLRAMQRVEDRLCGELAHEHAVVHAAVAADEECQAGADVTETSVFDQPEPVDAPAVPGQEKAGWRTRRQPRPGPRPLPSYEQARGIQAMLLLKDAAPDEPPTPHAQAP
jgi:hypothetical protein